MSDTGRIRAFVRESNMIEGIHREPTPEEIDATAVFILRPRPEIDHLEQAQAVFAPGKPLRSKRGMNVRVGAYIAPAGGPEIRQALCELLAEIKASNDPWAMHVAYERLHPFMDGNGRTGRLLWAWQMNNLGRDPFGMMFLHRFYYQTLEASDRPAETMTTARARRG